MRSTPSHFPRPEPATGGFTTSGSGACQYIVRQSVVVTTSPQCPTRDTTDNDRSEISLPPTPAGTVDDGDVEMPEAPAATANDSTNLDDHFLFLNRDEAEQVLKFRDNVRACQTDDEKYNLCTPIRDALLDKRTGLELLANVYHHVMQAECPGYAEWKTSQRRTKRKRNAEEDAA
jgi:hypothetical protein